TSGPESLLKAKVIEKDPQSAQVSGESTPPDESGAATLSADPAGTTPQVDTKPTDTKPTDTKATDTKPSDSHPSGGEHSGGAAA
ncbi:MAG TPA: hypothetical protein VMS92_23955, partial [Mycobacterium sp.]|nr:hypothetical protein [Mycobacterium sp.]